LEIIAFLLAQALASLDDFRSWRAADDFPRNSIHGNQPHLAYGTVPGAR
jgi:hypothetical protein